MGFKKGQVPWNKGTKGLQVSWNKGKQLSEEWKKNLSKAAKRRWKKPEERKAQSERRKGSTPFNKGKPWNEWMSKEGEEKQRNRLKSRIGKTYEEIYGKDKGNKLREERSGSNSWNWKDGRSRNYYWKLMAREQVPSMCVDCGKLDKLCVHHIDGNHYNNQIENLEFVCVKHHRKRHPWKHREETKRKIAESVKRYYENNVIKRNTKGKFVKSK